MAKGPHGQRSRGRRGGRSSGCREPDVRALLLPYVLSRCTRTEASAFEAHLPGCAACFRDLRCLGRLGTLLRELLGAKAQGLDGR